MDLDRCGDLVLRNRNRIATLVCNGGFECQPFQLRDLHPRALEREQEMENLTTAAMSDNQAIPILCGPSRFTRDEG